MRAFSCVLSTFIFLLGCAHTQSTSNQATLLFEECWQANAQLNPIYATYMDIHAYNDRLNTYTKETFEQNVQLNAKCLAKAKALQQSRLSPSDSLDLKIFILHLENELAEAKFHWEYLPLSSNGGFHTAFAELNQVTPFKTEKDYRNYIARLKQFALYTDQHIEIMKEGLQKGFVPAAIIFNGYEKTISDLFVNKPEDHITYTPFKNISTTLTDEQKTQLRNEAKAAIAEAVGPAYKKFYRFWKEDYAPKLRKSISVTDLPNGKAYYEFAVKKFTTLEKSPKEIHELGLREVARIKKEMLTALQETQFKGTYPQFIRYLRENPRFYAKTKEQLLKEVSLVLKKMDGKLPELFKTLPRTPYGIKEIPSFTAPKQSTAYYYPPAADGTRAGFYYVNTYKLNSRPLYEIEALSLHEAVPGHHLQIALQQEMANVPKFRQYFGFTAFTEGWGLYAESLGKEVGFYTDPYSNFGRLTYEMWRACRLVVDTGIHAYGWSREQAIQFMADNTALTAHNIASEVDRYIGWPGQALAYKLGQLKITELRERSQKALGKRFDIREFHDVILSQGAIPLPILEENVQEYIRQKQL